MKDVPSLIWFKTDSCIQANTTSNKELQNNGKISYKKLFRAKLIEFTINFLIKKSL